MEYRKKSFLLVSAIAGIAVKKGISQHEIARRTGMHYQNVNRIFNKKYVPRMDLLIKISESIGVDIIISDKEISLKI